MKAVRGRECGWRKYWWYVASQSFQQFGPWSSHRHLHQNCKFFVKIIPLSDNIYRNLGIERSSRTLQPLFMSFLADPGDVGKMWKLLDSVTVKHFSFRWVFFSSRSNQVSFILLFPKQAGNFLKLTWEYSTETKRAYCLPWGIRHILWL